MAESDWAFVVVTIALVIATLVLAWFTQALYKATERLAKVEERRDQEEARRMQRNRLKRKLELAEKTVDAPPHEVFDVLANRSLPGEARILRELRHLIDFDTDQVRRVDIDQILHAFDNVRAIRHEEIIGELRVVFERIQETLSGDLFRWRNEVNA